MNRFKRPNVLFLWMLVLVLLTWLISISPLLKFRFKGIFFSIDPDVMYVSNAISYIKAAQIHYIDHPGTPTIWIISKALIPVRLFSKLIAHTNFITWYVTHPGEIYLYLRLFQSLLLSFSVYIFLVGIYRLNRSLISTLTAWLLFISFKYFLFFGIVISAEILSTLITCIWLYILSLFMIKRHPFFIVLLSLVAGMATANKLTNIFLLFGSLLMPLILRQFTYKQKVLNIILNLLIAIASVAISTWPIRSKYSALASWIYRLLTKSGVHGGGIESLFDWQTYLNSVRTLFENEKVLLGVIVFVTTVVILKLSKSAKFTWIVLSFVSALTVLGVFIFAKYPLSHYQQTHFLILSYVAIFIIHRRHFLMQILVIIVVLSTASIQIQRYWSGSETHVFIASQIETEVKNQQSDLRVWEWAPSKELALLWGLAWSSGSYDIELKTSQPNFFALSGNMQNYMLDYSNEKALRGNCFDLYIQEESLPKFRLQNPDIETAVTPILGTYVTHVESRECQTRNK